MTLLKNVLKFFERPYMYVRYCCHYLIKFGYSLMYPEKAR